MWWVSLAPYAYNVGMGKLDWMEMFGWRARAEEHREATNCPCYDCRRVRAHRAGWLAIGRAFRTIAYWRFLRWQAERERADWPSLTTLGGVDSSN